MKQINQSISIQRKNVIIIGCGLFGAALALDAFQRGHRVTVVDCREEAFDRLPASYGGFLLAGDGTEEAVLLRAGIREADILAAATGDDDTNIMISQIAAAHYKIRNVLAKIEDAGKRGLCGSMSIQVVCPTLLAVDEAAGCLFGRGAGA